MCSDVWNEKASHLEMWGKDFQIEKTLVQMSRLKVQWVLKHVECQSDGKEMIENASSEDTEVGKGQFK